MNKWSLYFADVAKRTAQLSTARKLRVGAVAVRENRIIACGYNGTPPGDDNTCETAVEHREVSGAAEITALISTGEGWLPADDTLMLWERLSTLDTVIHAEDNLIRFIKRVSTAAKPLEGASLYITHAPCPICAGKIAEAGFVSVFYEHDYKTQDGIVYLNRAEILCKKIDRSETLCKEIGD